MEDFKSTQNKGLLWNLLYEGGVFHGISGELAETVKEKLEQVVEETWDRRLEGDDLKELNKRVCQMMLVASERMRAQSISAPQTTSPPLVTAEELSKQRQAAFSNNLERKQSEFTQMMTNDRPTDINFADKSERIRRVIFLYPFYSCPSTYSCHFNACLSRYQDQLDLVR